MTARSPRRPQRTPITRSCRPRTQSPPALLAMEDGTIYRGFGFGAAADGAGEIVFNTAITGYQEVLTDPSYRGQIVTMTAPEIGNVGVNPLDFESPRPFCAGFVVRELSPVVSRTGGRKGASMPSAPRNGVAGITGIDTRAVTRQIRTSGAQRAIITRAVADAAGAVSARADTPAGRPRSRARGDRRRGLRVGRAGLAGAARPERLGRGAARRKTTWSPTTSASSADILRRLRSTGCRVTRRSGGHAGERSAGDEARRHLPLERPRRSGGGGLCGRGDARALPVGKLPVFGICLGHQILGPRPRRQDLQAEVRPPRRQPAGHGPRHAQGGDHLAKPRLRRRRRFHAGEGACSRT